MERIMTIPNYSNYGFCTKQAKIINLNTMKYLSPLKNYGATKMFKLYRNGCGEVVSMFEIIRAIFCPKPIQ